MLRPSKRVIAGALIVAFWAAMMGHLVYRNAIVPMLFAGSAVPRAQVPQDLWMGLYLAGGEYAGFINSESIPGARGGEAGVSLRVRASLELSLLGRETDLSVNGAAWLAEAGGLRDFDFTLRSGGSAMQAKGKVENGLLTGEFLTGGEAIPLSFPVGDTLALNGGMALPALDVPNLEVGREIYLDTFDPMTMRMGKAKVACTGIEPLRIGEETVKTKVVTTTIGGIATKAWLTETGEIVRAETPFGFTLKKIRPEDAFAPIQPTEQASIIRTMAIAAEGKPPAADLDAMTLVFRGVPPSLDPPTGPTQQREGDAYRIVRPAAPQPGAPGTPLPPDERAAALASDPFVPANHPKISDQARRIAGEETDPWRKALLVHDWVFEHIEKEPVASVPAALDVLQTRRGDCNEHTVLFVALARALGIPSRIAVGLVWSGELEAFGYHAWPEVHVGAWIPMDPTFGQPLADATHIKLLDGGIDRWPQLVPYLGQLRIEVLDTQPAAAAPTESPA